MEIDGYTEFLPEEPHAEVRVFLSADVEDYFDTEGQKGRRNAGDVRKATITLTTLKRHGLLRVQKSIQFKREGKFPSGRRKGGQQIVYEVKSDQVRVYGGPISHNGASVFCFVEATTKKKDKADIKQLQRVAKALGAIQDELEKRR